MIYHAAGINHCIKNWVVYDEQGFFLARLSGATAAGPAATKATVHNSHFGTRVLTTLTNPVEYWSNFKLHKA